MFNDKLLRNPPRLTIPRCLMKGHKSYDFVVNDEILNSSMIGVAYLRNVVFRRFPGQIGS